MLTLPRVKSYTSEEGSLIINGAVSYSVEDSEVIKVTKKLFDLAALRLGITVKRQIKDAVIAFVKTESKQPEYYEIEIRRDRIFIKYTDILSARNALSTLICLAVKRGGEVYLPAAKICDYPDCSYRSAMIDLARKYVPIETIKLYIRIMALSKYNRLHIHLLDAEHYAIKSEYLEPLTRSDIRQYTKDEMREIVSYAASFGIEVIPEIDIPAHGVFMLERIPQIKCQKDGEPIGKWTLCVGNEKSYEIVETLIAELCEIFESPYIHIGGDELSFYDLKEYEYWPAWYECDLCGQLAKEKGYKEAHDFFCHFVRGVHEVAGRYNKKLIIWNDAVDISRPAELPKDILIQFWRVAMPGRGPYEGCSMRRFLEEGYSVINSSYRSTYADGYIKENELLNWSPFSDTEEELQGLILGGETCAWGNMFHFNYTYPSVLALFADRLWNKAPLSAEEPKEIDDALFRQLIAPIESKYNIFTMLGQRIFPFNDVEKVKAELATDDPDMLDKAFEEINSLIKDGFYENGILIPYLMALQEARLSVRRKKGVPLPPDLL